MALTWYSLRNICSTAVTVVRAVAGTVRTDSLSQTTRPNKKPANKKSPRSSLCRPFRRRTSFLSTRLSFSPTQSAADGLLHHFLECLTRRVLEDHVIAKLDCVPSRFQFAIDHANRERTRRCGKI